MFRKNRLIEYNIIKNKSINKLKKLSFIKKISLFFGLMFVALMSFAQTTFSSGFISCAEAVDICEATGTVSTSRSYTIRGYVTEIKTAYDSGYGNISFWMADSKDGGRVFS